MIQCPIQIVEAAGKLVSNLVAQPLPADFDPGDESYNQILASIRHEYTNYEELYYQIPFCTEITGCNEDECCPCPRKVEAHDVLKWAANGQAQKVYQEWLRKKSEMEAKNERN